MYFSKNYLHIRRLLLFFAVMLMTTTLSAQTIVKNTDESQKTEETEETEETEDSKITEVAQTAQPEKPPRFGGHVGIVIPIVTRGNNTTTTIADNFIIGFPFALVVRTNSPAAFDFEFVPIINTQSNQKYRFLVHPGIVYSFKKKYVVGVRAAYEFGTGNYGFTPIVNRSFKITEKVNYFIEADFPVRREERLNGTGFTSFQFAIHSGISF